MSHTTYRNRHLRGETVHFGDLEATLVELAATLGADLTAGMTLQEVLGVLEGRLQRLEGAEVAVGSFTIDAYLRELSFLIDALVKGTPSDSFTADSVVFDTVLATLTADAFILGWFTIDAEISSGTVSSSFSADAIVYKTIIFTFGTDAVIFKTITPTFDANAVIMPIFTIDAWLAAVGEVTGSFTADAITKKTMGDAAIPDFESVSAPKTIDSSDVSWTHASSADTKGIIVFIFRGFGFGTPTVTYGGLTLTQRSGYAADPRVHAYTRTDLTGKASDTVRVQDATFTPYAYSILISNTRAIEYVDNVNGFGDTGYNDMFSAISTGWDGLAIMLGQEIGTGSGDHMSPYGTDVSWSTAVGYSTTPTKHWVWYGDVNDGDDVGTHHDNVIADQSFQAIAFRSIDRAAFAFTVDATVMPVFDVDAVILKTVAATFDMDAMIMPIFTIDAYIEPYFTIDAVIAEEGASTRDPLSDYDNHWHPRARVEEDGSSANTALITIEKYERSK